jgi:DNA-directed RNA polymerase specialized sigma24 family protein
MAEQQQPAEGQRIRRHHPLPVGVGEPQFALGRGQRDVHDRGYVRRGEQRKAGQAADLVRAYSKRPDLCEELVRTIRNLDRALSASALSGPASVCSTGRSARDWRVSDRVSDSEASMIVMAFSRGTSKRELAERYGISESSVKRLLRRHRVQQPEDNILV